MKRKIFSLLIGAALIAAVFSGCGVEITSVTGTVVDARSDSLVGIGNVMVTFTPVNEGTQQTTTTSADGSYSMAYTGEGSYKVTASLSGWFFIPQTVYVGGWLQSVPNILGIALDTKAWVKDTSLSFILTWNNSYKDLDSFLTFPDGGGNGFEGSHSPKADDITFTNPYSPIPAGTGFGPNTKTYRETVAYGTSESLNTVGDVLGETDGRAAIELDRDDRDGAGPEVITVRSLPYWISTWNSSLTYGITGNSSNRLPTTVDSTSVTWTWIGVMEYYVDGWDSVSSTNNSREDDGHLISNEDGTGADAVLHIVQGARLLGAFRVPDYANIRTASLVKVNLFLGEKSGGGYTSYFQFVPDIQIVDYNGGAGIMSVGDEPAQVFGTFGAVR